MVCLAGVIPGRVLLPSRPCRRLSSRQMGWQTAKRCRPRKGATSSSRDWTQCDKLGLYPSGISLSRRFAPGRVRAGRCVAASQ
jgi:hypothetical protein